MTRLGNIVEKIRSKNAGPFWLTIDIFCGGTAAFNTVSSGLHTAAIAKAFHTNPAQFKRFDIAALNVIKISLPRPEIQGSAKDRDMHGASFAALLADLEI